MSGVGGWAGIGLAAGLTDPDAGLGAVPVFSGQDETKGKHIGVVAGTPPATVMAREGLMTLAQSFPLTIDTRVDAPSHTMADEIASGQLDAGVLRGPIAGYYAQRENPHLTVVPLLKEHERMDFRIAMGVRRSDQDWKRRLNRLIAENQPEFDRILTDYGVPMLDERGQPTSQ